MFPTPEQEELMWKHINSCRFVWNYMLGLQIGRYENGRKYMSFFDMSKELTYMKKHELWLSEVANHSLQQTCRDLDKAYKGFFNKIHGKPKFKSRKKAKLSFPLDQNIGSVYFIENETVCLPKIGKVKYQTNYKLPMGRKAKLCNPRVQYIKSSKKWILTFALEYENQIFELNDISMGIDLGVKELAVAACGDNKIVYHNINKSKRMRRLNRKKRHIERAISRKYRTNGNYDKTKSIEKYEQILREIEAKIANIRVNYLHQTTRQLVNLLPKRVVMEDLNVSGMMKNKHLSKAIGEQGFFAFREYMKYKCEEYGIEFVVVDRFYPSSKICSDCGHKKVNLKLNDRVYVCPVCGLEIDRDYNAARNLMNYKYAS